MIDWTAKLKQLLRGTLCLAFCLPVLMAAGHATEGLRDSALPYETDSLLVKLSVPFGGLMTMSCQADDLSRYGGMELLFSLENEQNSPFRTFLDRGTQTSWYALTLEEGQDLEETKQALEQEAGVLAVTYNFRISPIADEPQLFTAAAESTTAMFESQQWHLQSSGLPEAQAYLTENGFSDGGDSEIIVAVLDTGVDYTHPDLKDNILRAANGSVIGEDTTRDDSSDCRPDNVSSTDYPGYAGYHGTHCAGIIAASGAKYVRGVADTVKIMPVKVLSTAAGNELTILKGIRFAYQNGAKIVSMSIGVNVTETTEYDANGNAITISRALWESAPSASALHDAIRLYDDEMIFVAAAGNDGRPNEDAGGKSYIRTYPAAWPEVIGVMSSNQAADVSGNWLSAFSNWDVTPGNEPEYDITAPGVSILSTVPISTGSYAGSANGTSMATPFVAGCAALLLTKYIDNNNFTIQDVKRILLENVEIKQGISVKGVQYSYPAVRIDRALSYRERVHVDLPRYTYAQLESTLLPDLPQQTEQNTLKLSYFYISDTYQSSEAPSEPGVYTIHAEVDSIYYTGEAEGMYTVYRETGDFNGDGRISGADLEVYRRHAFGKSGAPGKKGSRYAPQLDFDRDGQIDLKDVTRMSILAMKNRQNGTQVE